MDCPFLLQWTTFCQTSPLWPVCLGWPHMAWLSFIELGKTVVRVIRLASFLWLWFQCVCPLMPSRNTYHLTWVSLTLDVGYLLPRTWGISSWLFQQRAATAPYLDKVAPPDLERGVAPLCLPVPAQPSLLGHGVSPLIHHPWPRVWGSSSRPLPLTSNTLAKEYSKFSKWGFNSMWTKTFQIFKQDLEKVK